MLTIIIGKSASGKNFIMNQHLLLGAKPVITYTTRPIRKGEKNGKDYHFVSVQKFMNLRKKHKFAECRSYRTLVDNKPEYWWYGSPLINVENNDYVIILDIQGAISYIQNCGNNNIAVEYVICEGGDQERERRAKQRGSFDKTEWDRRLKDDATKFSDENIAELEECLGHNVKRIYN